MRKLLVSGALAASLLTSVAAQAQTIPPASVAVVDLSQVTSQCTACKVATTTLRNQYNSMQAREKALATPLEAEQKSIQAAIDALNGKEADAALTARIKSFQARQQAAAQELSQQQDQIKASQNYISQQIQAKLGPIYQSVMQKRGANVLLEVGATLATSATVDVTSDVLAGLNAALPTLSTTAPAQPQGR